MSHQLPLTLEMLSLKEGLWNSAPISSLPWCNSADLKKYFVITKRSSLNKFSPVSNNDLYCEGCLVCLSCVKSNKRVDFELDLDLHAIPAEIIIVNFWWQRNKYSFKIYWWGRPLLFYSWMTRMITKVKYDLSCHIVFYGCKRQAICDVIGKLVDSITGRQNPEILLVNKG